MKPSVEITARRCPLCGQPNGCERATPPGSKSSCWCFAAKIPAALLNRVPPSARDRACICRDCVAAFHRASAAAPLRAPKPE